MNFFLIIIIEIALLLIIIWLATSFFNIIFRGFAPLIASRERVIDLILDAIKLHPNQVIYELGSGSAKFLQRAEKKFPEVKLIGLEYSTVPFLFSNLALWLKNSRIKIQRQNMFKANLQDADFIYCYLLPSMMPNLGEKIRKECKPGTTLISYMFSVPDWRPEQTIRQNHDTIYFYEV